MPRPLIGALALFGLGLIIGAITDEKPSRPVEMRAGYRVIQGDFHVHTRTSDGFLSPMEAVINAERQGLDAVGITEHNTAWPGRVAAWFAEVTDGPVVVVGQELTTNRYHLIILGLQHTVSWRLSLADAIDDAHAQGAVAIAAHPATKYWPAYDAVLDKLDGSEVVHPIALRESVNPKWRWEDMITFWKRSQQTDRPLAAIGSSDFHAMKAMGICRTYLFVNEVSSAGVIDAIRNQRTVAFGPKEQAFGRPELVAALRADPIPQRGNASYTPNGGLDLLGRLMGIFGLLGILVLRRVREPQAGLRPDTK
jgi:predicted metal-dependent phosphoesterase TrpH